MGSEMFDSPLNAVSILFEGSARQTDRLHEGCESPIQVQTGVKKHELLAVFIAVRLSDFHQNEMNLELPKANILLMVGSDVVHPA